MKESLNSHVKVGDTIKVITGTNKKTTGTITSILRKKSLVFVEGLLPRIKYIKNPQGGDPKKVELPTAIHISNVMLWDKKTETIGRIGYQTIENKKTRYFKKSGNII